MVPVATGQIDGAVVGPLLHPFSNQAVHLVQADRVDYTSDLGGFTFRNVPVGFYTLTTRGPDGATAAQVVDVEAGRITRVILQLLPIPQKLPYFEALSFHSFEERPQRGGVCEGCAWVVPLGADAPAEMTFEALWQPGPVLGPDRDRLDIVIRDDRGFPLFEGRALRSPVLVSIDGADVHPDARELHVEVAFGPDFLPRTAFTMDSVMTLYHGATKAQMFGIQ